MKKDQRCLDDPDSFDEETSCVVRIQNNKGLHARAAAKFVKTAQEYQAIIWVEHGTKTVSGSSLMGLLLLSASKGTSLTLKAKGPQRVEALKALTQLVDTLFHESA